MRKIFLSGGTGFIGKNILEQSASIYDIDSPTRKELDLTDIKQVNNYFSDKFFDCIIHTAGSAITRKNIIDPAIGFYSTVSAFSSVFNQSHAYKKFIHLGSGAEYGRPITERQIHESQLEKKTPEDSYGLSKQTCSKLLSQSGKKSVSLVLFGVFGPYEDYQVRFISNAIVRTLHHLPIVMNQNAEFDYVSVFDLVRIIHHFIKKKSYSGDNRVG